MMNCRIFRVSVEVTYVFIKRLIVLLFVAEICTTLNAQTILEADGPGNTYELINSVLAPGYNVVENPECAHPEFGRHITEAWDSDLNQYVFDFHIHVTPDNDRCINFDRQRMEIKTYDNSPANLIGVGGETVTYKWKFKLPVGFKASSNFTHLHQIKAVGGDDDDPLFVLTARKGNPDKMELNYYVDSNLSSVKLATADLSLFENVWVEVTERVRIDNTNGAYSIVVKNIKTGAVVLSYSNDQMLTIRYDNRFIRPKWGVYRSLLNAQDLRDEIVRFAGFSIAEDSLTSFLPSEDPGSSLSISYINTDDSWTKFFFCIQENCNVSLKILNMKGQIVKTLLDNSFYEKGKHHLKFDLCNLPDGIYVAHLWSGDTDMMCKFMVAGN